jgi:two-component system, OmpR family, sensor histidine kinase SenX3
MRARLGANLQKPYPTTINPKANGYFTCVPPVCILSPSPLIGNDGRYGMNIAVTQQMNSNWTVPVQPAGKAQMNALAIVAHDLRGPLSNLSALFELIEMHGARQNGDGITSCTTRAAAIIDNLVDMLNSILDRAKATGDPLGYVPSKVNVTALMRQVAEQNQPSAAQNNVTLTVTSTTSLPIWADGPLLSHALDNLLGNAVKHSEPGSTVACHVKQYGQKLVIQVTNKSADRNELDLRRAFQPFTKLSARSRTDRRSWGLGLWIVRLIAERHGGKIEGKTSGSDRDVTFTLSLPI